MSRSKFQVKIIQIQVLSVKLVLHFFVTGLFVKEMLSGYSKIA